MKKKLSILALVISTIAFSQASKDYLTLKGKITEKNSDSLVVIGSRSIIKKINVSEDGTFSDTLKVEAGSYRLFDGREQTSVYLKNGFDLNLTLDTKQFDETIVYTGKGADVNNYLAKKALMQEVAFSDPTMMDLGKVAFKEKVNGISNNMVSLLKSTRNLDPKFVAEQNKQIDGLKNYLLKSYEQNVYINTVLAKGKDSPKFVDYENYAGGKMSLDDLKGKYVYIDVWATWCGPCKAEIPYLKEVEKAYHGKNIEFVSISVDVAKNYEKWKQMIAEKELGGIQLLADKSFESKFVGDYKINGIPRFILIDPQGKIVSATAPRPSSGEELIKLFNDLKI